MDLLKEARAEIGEIDREMAALFTRRMAAAARVAAYKKEHGLPVLNAAREQTLTARNLLRVPPDLRPYYRGFFEAVLCASRNRQTALLSGMRIAYSGVPGAFAHTAARRIFPAGEAVAFPDFESAYRAAERGECHAAVLPIENSYAGDVGQVLDLAFAGPLSVSGVFDLPLSQYLLARPGVNLPDIREVVSHPQALSQCAPFLRAHGFTLTQAENTAMAAKKVAGSARRDLAAVGSREAAALYGLSVLGGEINEQRHNTTRFAVFSPAEVKIGENDRRFLLLFTTKDAPGALGEAISVISRRHFNLTALKSHPTGSKIFAYYFFVEGEGNLGTPEGRGMLSDLLSLCSTVRVLGSYGQEKVIDRETSPDGADPSGEAAGQNGNKAANGIKKNRKEARHADA